MASIYARGGKLWARIKNQHGKWVSKRTPFVVGQERQAREHVRKSQDLLASKPELGVSLVDTVRTYAATWIGTRREADLDWKNDESRLKHHVLPVIGDMKIGDVRARHIVELFHQDGPATGQGTALPAHGLQRLLGGRGDVPRREARREDRAVAVLPRRAPTRTTHRQGSRVARRCRVHP